MIEVQLPKWGMTMQEGYIANWLVASGDTVILGQVIATVETDKVEGEVESPAAGVINILVDSDQTVEVGKVIATVSPE